MKNYLHALKRRKEETGESGFSLIELIVVVVILGILAAIAVPVFMGLQDQAAQSAVDTAAANGASQAAADFAQDKTVAEVNTALGTLGGGDFTLVLDSGSTDLEDFCVTATEVGGTKTGDSGPGC